MSGWTNKTSLHNEAVLPTAALRVVAFALTAVYIGWNALNLWYHQLPPSLFLAITSVPCPTTGSTRAIMALLHGNPHQSLRWNPMAVPYVLMTVASFLGLANSVIKHGRLQLSPVWLKTWLMLLAIGWSIQFFCFLAIAP